MTWIELLDKLSPLIGVLIGGLIGLMSPWIGNIINNKNRKRSIKYELVNNVYFFYNLFKLQLGLQNQLRFITKRLDLFHAKKIANTQNDLIEYNELNKSLDENFLKLTEMEAKLVALNIEVGDYYGAKIYNSLTGLLRKPLTDSNNLSKLLVDFRSLTDKEFIDNAIHTLSNYDFKMSNDLQSDCDSLINKINYLLK